MIPMKNQNKIMGQKTGDRNLLIGSKAEKDATKTPNVSKRF